MSIMQMKNFGKDNGATFNAKGDLQALSNFVYDATATDINANALITFKSDGTWTVSGATNFDPGQTVPDSGVWVTTGAGWQGGANYTLSWTKTSGTGGESPTNTPGSQTLATDAIFEVVSTPGNNDAGAWNITITNDASGTQTPESISFTITITTNSQDTGGS